MSDKTSIEWTRSDDGAPGATWNPVRGCSKVSEGCRHCYAMSVAHRFSAPGEPYEGLTRVVNGKPEWTGEVTLVESVLRQPMRWTKPRRVFVNSMADLFHPNVPDEFIARVFAVMAHARQHTFQILTKRPDRMLQFMQSLRDGCVLDVPREAGDDLWGSYLLPLPNVWLGVSVEDQAAADERVPLLLQTRATVRFLSCEPLLGKIDLTPYLRIATDYGNTTEEWAEAHGWRYNADSGGFVGPGVTDSLYDPQPGIHWVIVGGESGKDARPIDPLWATSLRDQCQAAGVPYFFKQWGEVIPRDQWRPETVGHPLAELEWQAAIDAFGGIPAPRVYYDSERWGYRVGKKLAGRLLDGREWNEYPEAEG